MSVDFEKYNMINTMVSVDSVFDFIGATLHKDNGSTLTYTCPYHTDELPSLNIDTPTGRFNCLGCDCKGKGAYGAAKHYLTKMNTGYVGALTVLDFLRDINPNVEQLRYLFSVKQIRQYEYGVDKKKKFSERLIIPNPRDIVLASKSSWTPEQFAIYVDCIMNNMPDELLLQLMDKKKHKVLYEDSKEFLSLLGE